MKSYFISIIVVLLLVISYNVILSNKNDTFRVVDKFSYRDDSEESLEEGDLKVSDAATKVEDSLDTLSTTTFRPVRLNSTSSSPHQRDTKLMNVLAARRSALQNDRFRTHSRIVTTARTKPSTEPTSKAPSVDSKTKCVRNCMKNFTRSASCMRQCTISIQRRNNTTTSSITNNNNSSEEERSQRDNNEILFTDESSHGFFVVAKDANDTMNHISELRKIPGILSGGNVYKGRARSKPNVSLQVPVDSEPDSYLYFGRKIPSLRPSFLSISTVSDEHPQVFEVSVSQKPPSRPKSSNKFNPRDRLSSPFTRKLNAGKFAPFVSPDPIPVSERTSSKNDTITLKPIEQQNSSAEVQVQTESELPSLKLIADAPLSREVTLQIEDSSQRLLSERPSIAMVNPSPEVSTPLIINVIDEDEITVAPDPEYATTTNPTALDIEDGSTELTTIEAPSNFSDDKTNLIIFVNKSMNTVTPSSPPPPPPSVQTETTIFSSVRSTVYPAIVTNKAAASMSTEKDKKTGAEETVDITSPAYENPEITIRALTEVTDELESRLAKDSNLSRLNIATYTLAGLGMIPVFIGVVYLARSLILKGYSKHDEDFDVCITDQKPISPVKKIEKYDEEEEESGQYEQCSISSRDEFNRANLRLKSLLGEGNFGKVWKAEADDLSGHIGATRIVAVKTVRSGSSQNDLREEATIMRKLGSHPNIVTLLGACLESEPQMLIMEFAMRGRLLSLLRAARSATNILPASVPGGKSLAPLSPRTLAGFSLDIAAGMEYIADKRIVHRDLAARNILIDHNGICKICDFGMSTDLDAVQKDSDKHYDVKTIRTASSKLDKFKFDLGERFMNNWTNGFNTNGTKKSNDSLGRRPALPIRWMAPEALQYNEFSIETDVWAFGIVLWEIATLGATPYSNLSGREVVRHVLQGTRPELPKDGRHGFFELMLQCWHKAPAMRPTFREARLEISRSVCKWLDEDAATSDYMDVSGFSEDLEHGMVYFNQRISEFECEI